ncbi:GSCOCT00014184001.2-RA-CDS [Cotesia congregata]|uniref:Cc_bv9.5_28.10 n=2 Tax=root TaxID=1 RepID=S6D2Y0_COTCN|nr:GSCOCT00014184001.2-RA-CDS [Cotesia congregata]CAG5092480.1 cc_bv9.5_28.10 [Cotesia congregata]CCB96401.1 hypothetical protein BV9-5 [Bracoviriform congregatae]CCQ71212.1 hypothetical protein BV9-5 [Cotesia congregata]
MIAAKKFCVDKLTENTDSGRSPYKVVPTFWIKNENNNITVPYPPEEKLAQNFDRIFDCQLPLAEWEDYHVVIDREADTYEDGVLYIKRQSSKLLNEETLLVWKQIDLDSLEQMASLNPLAIFRKLWSKFLNLFGK